MKRTDLVLALALVFAAACAHRRPAPAPPPPAAAPPLSPAPAAPPTAPSPPLPPAPPVGPEGAPAATPITFAAVGDVMLGSTFPEEGGGLLPPDDGRTILAEVAPALRGADVAFGNLEGPLLDGGTSEKCRRSRPGRCYAFRVPTRYGAHLAQAGFDVMSVANNHAGDFGEPGRASTRATLRATGILATGAPDEIARLEVRGRRVAVVAFSTSSGTNDVRDLEAASRLVARAAGEADLVVVSFHGGAEGAAHQHVPLGPEEFLGEDRGDLRAFARAVVEAGADLVLGHGPHVVRGMEVIGGRLVAYSLGNFATYGGFNLSGPNGLSLVLEARLAPDGAFLDGRIHPVRQERPGGPRLDASGQVVPVLRRLSEDDFGPTAVRVADDGTLSPPEEPATAPSRPTAAGREAQRSSGTSASATSSAGGNRAGSSRP